MIPTWLLVIFVIGVNFTIWGMVGLARMTDQRLHPVPDRPAPAPVARSGPTKPTAHVTIERVAVLMAAHNEELVLARSLAAITELVPARNVHVVSDGSTDRTVELAIAAGVHVVETPSNVGKAGALAEGIRRFELPQRYRAVLLLDADTRLHRDYFRAALPLFDDPAVVAIAGCAVTDWESPRRGFVAQLLTAHRSRVYALVQRLVKFGQAWRRTNAVSIVPGFASLYRSEVLPDIDINPPGLVIEDFNMTFEVYQRNLGKVGFCLEARAMTQDPDQIRDYIRQVKRWALGFWQTVRRYRPGANLFTAMLGLFALELVTASLLMMLLPPLVILLAVPELVPASAGWPGFGDTYRAVAEHLSLGSVGLGVLLPDVLLTAAVAAVEHRPRYLLWAPLFLLMRAVDAALALYTLPLAWLRRSDGRWRSPSRRSAPATIASSG
ncbi:MAG TPA: glycosyltransferase family 2 protein [Actinophytocola sp.]|jgi:cellulose synthase/poly-beta-1,6-N-acetylglucosamine synthase-like glycosyltransferase|uniref:glycosyltransferase family 2 protein n=1 Tax=Actinophytocola sp. TaxID=1872138 RepID=UPI002F91FEE1